MGAAPSLDARFQASLNSKLAQHKEEIRKLLLEIDGNPNCKKLRDFDIKSWDKRGAHVIKLIESVVTELSSMETNVGITKIAGGTASALGGLMVLGGIVAAPFTLGGTLGLTAVGATLGAAGGLTAGGGGLAKYFIMKDKMGGELRDECDRFSRETAEMGEILKGIIEPLRRLSVYLNDMSYAIHKETMPGFERLPQQAQLEHVKAAAKVLLKPVSVVLTGIRVVNIAQIGTAISAFSKSVTFGGEFLKLAAAGLAAPGLAIPQFVSKIPLLKEILTPQVLIQPAKAGAVALQGLLAVVGIGFGVWDIIEGAQSLDGCSAAVNDLRAKIEEIRVIMDVFNEAKDILVNSGLI